MKPYRALAPLATAVLIASVVLSTLAACSTASPTASPSASPSASPQSSAASPSASPKASTPEQQAYQKAQEDFNKVVEAARQEGDATIYSVFQLDILEKLAEGFNKVDPKIQVKFVRTVGAQAVERLRAEQGTKTYVASAYLGGSPTTRTMHGDNNTQAIDVPVLLDPDIKWLVPPTFDAPIQSLTVTFNKYLLMYNTNLVPAGQEPKTWKDLANPIFKNSLVMWDPRISGPPQSLYGFLYLHPDFGPDFVKTLAENTIPVPDSASSARAVAQGEGAVTLGTVASYLQVKDAPVKILSPSDGTIVGVSQIAIPKNAPEVNTARVFINWLLSKEGQAILGTGYGVVREGVEAEEKLGQILPNEKLFPNVPFTADYETKMHGAPIEEVKKWMAAAGR